MGTPPAPDASSVEAPFATGAVATPDLEPGFAPPAAGFALLTRDSAVFALGSFAGKVVAVLMLPVLTRLLPTSDFGRLDVLSTLLTALVSALLLGLDTAAVRLVFDRQVAHEQRQLLATWLALAVVIVSPATLALIVWRQSFSHLILHDGNSGTAIALVGVAALCSTLQYVTLTVLRIHRRSATFAGLTAGTVAGSAVLAIALLLAWERGLAAVIAAYAITFACAAAFGFVLVGRELAARPSRHAARMLLTVGLPLAPGVVALWGAEFAHRAILLAAAGPSQVAFFSVAVRFGSVGVLVATGYQLGWQPHTFARGTSPEALNRVGAEARQIVVAVCGLVTMLALVSPELVRIVSGRSYEPALPAVGWSLLLAVGLALYQAASMPSALATALGDLGLASGLGVCAAIAANVALAHRFGSAGTAAAVALGQVAAAAIAAALGRRRLSVPVPWPRLAGVTAVTAAVTLLVTLPDGGLSLPGRVAIGLAAAVVFAAEGTWIRIARYATERLRARMSTT